jgi:hypothetical protein
MDGRHRRPTLEQPDARLKPFACGGLHRRATPRAIWPVITGTAHDTPQEHFVQVMLDAE